MFDVGLPPKVVTRRESLSIQTVAWRESSHIGYGCAELQTVRKQPDCGRQLVTAQVVTKMPNTCFCLHYLIEGTQEFSDLL